MTTTTGTVRFRRVDATLWRDTGRHVLALPPGTQEVVVLGGGAAVLWRLLGSELSFEAIAGAVTEMAGSPGRDVVSAGLDTLVSAGLVTSENVGS